MDVYFGGRNQPTTDSTLNVPYGNVQHKARTREGSCRCYRGCCGVVSRACNSTGQGRFLLCHHQNPRPRSDRGWPARSFSALGGGSVWLPGLGGQAPALPLLPASASPLRCELHDSEALGWCSAQGTTLDLVPLHPPRRRGQRLEKWCLSASLTKQALCKQTTVYSGLPGRGAPHHIHSRELQLQGHRGVACRVTL